MFLEAVAEHSVVISHVTTAALSVAAINWLKSNTHPLTAWITQQKPNAMRVTALATAAIGAVGIHYTWDPTARMLSFTIPTLAALAGAVVTWAKAFIMQELTYQLTKRPSTAELVKAVVDAVRGGGGPKPAIGA